MLKTKKIDIQMENKDAQLIRKMMSLVESADNKANRLINESEEIDTPEVKTDIDESIVKTLAADAEMLANVLKNEKGLFSTLKNEIPALSKFKNADELIVALKDESNTILNLQDRYKILKQVRQVPEVAMKVRGLLSKSKNVQDMAKLAFPKGAGMPADAAKLKIAQDALVKSYGMSAEEAEVLLKNARQGSDVFKVGADAGKVGADAGKTTKELIGTDKWDPRKYWDKAKKTIGGYRPEVLKKIQSLKGKLNAKQIALYGLAGYGAYELLFGKSGGDEGKNTESVIPDCVANLPGVEFTTGTGGVAVATIPDGVDDKSKNHQGLVFWPNGRAITGDNKVRGNYYCKPGGGVAAQVSEELIGEVDYQNVHIDWDGDKVTPPTPTPTPIPKPKPIYKVCNDFPVTPGCKSDYIREIQVCLGLPQKYQTGNFGPITKDSLSKAGYDSSSIDKDTYLKITSNCGGKTETSGSTIQNIELPKLQLKMPKYNGPTPEQIKADLDAIANKKYGTTSTEPTPERQAQIIQGVKDRGFDLVYKGSNLNDQEKQWLLQHYNASGINKEKQKGDGQEKLRFK